MSYNLLYTKTAALDIKKLDTVARKKIRKKIETYREKPIYYGKKLVNSAIGSYRWRAGNYRIVFDIDGNNIVILRVGHRREIYK
ncbi:MAG: Addiction module toxin, RelE/StbE family [Candidatus Gottesmanbacteria bacterium GW2011_GWC2_39_8]|uniref:Addiction module toxin, RelE/StbE family n=1 Tax=Candidatus Gottesmanbacteria bacterium GW2011_GWC2_39_8 TaxID=1618450 RepID=A0A0G0PX94_9BACT|nr:MAG: Addiction module toxin, RelE/StbE family [Candidatus Gottesmanbacteria bacterium GW2011_GWC2_39_8]